LNGGSAGRIVPGRPRRRRRRLVAQAGTLLDRRLAVGRRLPACCRQFADRS